MRVLAQTGSEIMSRGRVRMWVALVVLVGVGLQSGLAVAADGPNVAAAEDYAATRKAGEVSKVRFNGSIMV